MSRREAVLRVLGSEHRWRTPFGLADVLFEELMDHPEGALVARLDPSTQLADNIETEDGLIHLSPAPMMAELARALVRSDEPPAEWPWVLAAGLRTRWTANTIHRDPAWRKGKGPHCSLSLNPEDASELGLDDGAQARLETARGAAELPVSLDARLPRGFVSVPNGFGVGYASGTDTPTSVDGLNLKELTAADERDPYTGCPQHKHVPCRVHPLTSARDESPLAR